MTNGTKIKKLQYRYEDVKNGKSSSGAKRGVCKCADGKSECNKKEDKQPDTLINWFLVHKASRYRDLDLNVDFLIWLSYSNNNFANCYGRWSWNGYCLTATTDPNPERVQGRVLHPDQNRVISVRYSASITFIVTF